MADIKWIEWWKKDDWENVILELMKDQVIIFGMRSEKKRLLGSVLFREI